MTPEPRYGERAAAPSAATSDGSPAASAATTPTATSAAAAELFSPPPFPEQPPLPALAPSPRRRRVLRAVGVAAGLVGLVALLVGGFFGWTVVADQRRADAAALLTDRQSDAVEALGALTARTRSSQAEADRVREVVGSAPFAADPDPTAEPLRTALGALDLALFEATEAAAAPAPAPTDEPSATEPAPANAPGLTLPWELTAEADQLEADAHRADTVATTLLATAEATDAAEEAVVTAEATYFSSLATRAQSEIDTNTLASRKSQVDLSYLIDTAADPALADYRDAEFVASLDSARQALRDSQAVEAAEADDPAFATRREIEAYARSLSAGVVLDFVWAPEVNGLGENWLSGTAETYDSDGGWSIISLNYTVEEAWADGDENARALVAHEVGHTQVIRDVCEPLFTGPVFASDHETWATAWSIGLGFDLPGSGIEAYGRPTDDQIATAAGCR
ncbi:hypothetical protein NVV95_17000 [Herbiconiux sp. CPCC 205716]|uniref:Uncharacterized protein n=1 Tax=Herbiconiux gentiana TaxID=2970912 RepID=A0ABT2GJ47_9MICO|nr:hypothetical protein [Herbiconiux gentiana]MCS5716248.1 hypothetical protein [Herbiconiux gentiana]